MTQNRTHDFGDPRDTNLLNRHYKDIIPKGVYKGFQVTAQAPETLSLDILLGGATESVVFTGDGVRIGDNADLFSAVSVDAGDPNPRIDIVVIDHTYSTFNTPAVYSVVKGTAAVNPSAPTLLSSQIELARVCVPANATVITNDDIVNVDPIHLEGGGDVFLPDVGSLRVEQHSPLNDQVYVQRGTYVKTTGLGSQTFAGGDSPNFAPANTDPRIDLLVIDDDGNLSIIPGQELAIPEAPIYPGNAHVLAEITIPVGPVVLIKQEQIRDVRPDFTFTNPGVNPSEEFFEGDNAQTAFTISNFVYTPGANEILVFIDKEKQRSGAGLDYVENANNEITFLTAPALGAKIDVYHIGRAESRNRFHPLVQEFVQDASGSTTDYQTRFAFTPGENELLVFVEGEYMTYGSARDFIELNGSTIQFVNVPAPNAKITVVKLGAAIGTDNFIMPECERFTANVGQTEFDLTEFTYFPTRKELEVYVGGNHRVVGAGGLDYTETGINQITFNTAMAGGEDVFIRKIGVAATSSGNHAPTHYSGGSDQIDLSKLASTTPGDGFILLSPNGTAYRVTVTDVGNLNTTVV